MGSRYGFPLSSPVKSCLINACVDNGDIDRASRAFAQFRPDGLDGELYGALLSGYLRFGQLTEAVTLVAEARGLPGGDSISEDHLELLRRSLEAAGLEAVGDWVSSSESSTSSSGLEAVALRAAEPLA